jgi:regulator of replication initiation timing
MTNNDILSIDRLLNLYNESLFENRELQKQLDWYKNYCDELIEHKDMVCLPADLRNLRESNAKLAIENNELKKIITQKWYDETAQKQIDIMIKNQSFPKDLYEDEELKNIENEGDGIDYHNSF